VGVLEDMFGIGPEDIRRALDFSRGTVTFHSHFHSERSASGVHKEQS
jgi:hypothetical protein